MTLFYTKKAYIIYAMKSLIRTEIKNSWFTDGATQYASTAQNRTLQQHNSIRGDPEEQWRRKIFAVGRTLSSIFNCPLWIRDGQQYGSAMIYELLLTIRFG